MEESDEMNSHAMNIAFSLQCLHLMNGIKEILLRRFVADEATSLGKMYDTYHY